MPLIPKKTYSRKNQEIHEEEEKEGVDPFDELLSSPLKQDVSFKPLSFWNKKLSTHVASNNLKKKNHALYETSDSDNPSPYRLNEKKAIKSKKFSGRKKNVFSKSFCVRVKNYSSVIENPEVNPGNNSFRFVTVRRQYNKYNYRTIPCHEKPYTTYIVSKDDLENATVSETSITLESSAVDDNENKSDRVYLENSSYYSFSQSSELESTWESENFSGFDVSESHGETLKSQGENLNSTSENDTFESAESETSDKENQDQNQPQSISSSEVNKDIFEGNNTLLETLIGKNIVNLTSMMSDMSIDKEKEDEDSNSTDVTDEDVTLKDKRELSDMFRNITKRKRVRNTRQRVSRLSNLEDKVSCGDIWDSSLDSPLVKKDRISVLPERYSCFSNPVFESTRVFVDEDREKVDETFTNERTLLSENQEPIHSIVLKSGKKWRRSLSVLKKIQSGSVLNLDSSRIKGRNFENFIQEIISLQQENSGASNLAPNMTLGRKNVYETTLKRCPKLSILKPSQIEEEEEEENSIDFDRTSVNHTIKIVKPETSLEEPSAFRSALGINQSEPSKVTETSETSTTPEKKECLGVTAKELILSLCKQDKILPFDEHFNEMTLKNCRKIGEGVYGEVYRYSSSVLKILPIEGNFNVNGEPQKKFEEILTEIVCASKLSNLRTGKSNKTSGFSQMKRCWCVMGKYPKYLVDLWVQYDKRHGSDNDSPSMFGPEQLYIILEMSNGGASLQSFSFTSSEQAIAVLTQVSLTLACAEKAFQFEHRDLHWGNVLVSTSCPKHLNFILDNVIYKVPTKGAKATIIDFTLSRLVHDGCVIFNNLAADPDLFKSHGDYQFEIYRMMRSEVNNDWSLFKPKTNVYWLHYITDKLIKSAKYKNNRSSSHLKFMKKMMEMEQAVLSFPNCAEFILKHGDL